MNLNELSESFYTLKKELDELTTKFEAAEKKYKLRIEDLKSQMKQAMSEQGLTQVKTDVATFFMITKKSVQTEDKEAFFNFVKTHDRFDLIQKTPLKSGVLDYLEEHGSLPDGLKYWASYDLSFKSV